MLLVFREIICKLLLYVIAYLDMYKDLKKKVLIFLYYGYRKNKTVIREII